MVHLRALPGAPLFEGSLDAVIDAALADVRALVDGGVDGYVVENFADHMVKHAVPLGAVDELQSARDLRLRALADAIVVSGAETGAPADPARLRRLREAMPNVPLVVGSGLTAENAAQFADADAAIAGTSVKRAGAVEAPVDRERVARLVAAFKPRGGR